MIIFKMGIGKGRKMNKTMEEYIQEAPDSIRDNIERRSFLTSGLSEKIAESGCHEICMVASGLSLIHI